jgi:hypothetical protein
VHRLKANEQQMLPNPVAPSFLTEEARAVKEFSLEGEPVQMQSLSWEQVQFLWNCHINNDKCTPEAS